jgi:competence protein ComEA
VTISPSLAALAGAATVALAVAFVLRPPQLAPRPEPALPGPAAAEPTPTAARPRTLVYVAGAVVHPGVYAVSGDARAQDALAKAGGAARDADLVAVNLAARVADGDEIAVPRQGEARPGPSPRSARRRTSAPGKHRRRTPRRAGAGAGPLVDLNAADAGTLAGLPGIGPTLAERIVAFRTINGPFASVDGLADVAGITPQRLDALLPRLTAGR